MSTSLRTTPALFELLRPTTRRKFARTIMATCIDNCHAKTAMNRLSYKCIEFSSPCFPDLVLRSDYTVPAGDSDEDVDEVWAKIREEAQSDVEEEPILQKYYFDLILSHNSLESALANHLANKLSVPDLLPISNLQELFSRELKGDDGIRRAVREDLRAARDRDPACSKMAHCFLYYKGFLACQAHRVAHRLWLDGRVAVALLIQSRVSEAFAVDIHPGAMIGSGLLLDHATGVVVGETAVVGENVSILHNVTLGGTGKASGDRHPKIGNGVLVGAGTQILGNVRIGVGAKVGAGSVVLKEVPPRTTAVGNPARLIGGKENPVRLGKMAGLTMDHTSWSDYVI